MKQNCITQKSGLVVKGHRGTWYVISETLRSGQMVYLLESEIWGDDAPCLIVDKFVRVIIDDVHNGFDDYDESDDGTYYVIIDNVMIPRLSKSNN